MPIDVHPNRKGPTPEQVIAEQKRQANASRPRQWQAAAKTSAPAKPTANVPAAAAAAALPATLAADYRTPQQRYLDDVAPTSIVGRLIKFSKDAVFITVDDEQSVGEEIAFAALCAEIQVGYVKFAREEGEETQYDGFVLPPRESLGDMDESQWAPGLSGEPEDPWKHFQNLVLEQVNSHELFTFSTTSKTGRRAVGNLLRHYDRMVRTHPDDIPLIRLKPGGFNHSDARIGWVPTPVFAVVGRAPRDSAAKPDASVAADMNDAMPHL